MVLHEYDKPLVYEDTADPCPGENEIVLKVRGAGMCQTDIKIVTGQLDRFISLPLIPGHETAGEIVETGKNVKNLKPGQKGVVYSIIGCKECEYCRTGNENLCISVKRIGFEADGGFAEYVRLPADNFCLFTADIPFEQMAILPDAAGTPYHAFKKIANPDLGKKVVIVGAGGLGLHAVQIAKGKGAFVIACDISREALDLAGFYGADLCIDSSDSSMACEAVMDATGGRGADIVLEGVGTSRTVEWSIKCLKKGGTMVVMGYDPVNCVPLPFIDIHNNELKIAGTKITTRQELAEVVELAEKGVIKPVVTKTLPLEHLNEGFDLVRNRRLAGRAAVKIS